MNSHSLDPFLPNEIQNKENSQVTLPPSPPLVPYTLPTGRASCFRQRLYAEGGYLIEIYEGYWVYFKTPNGEYKFPLELVATFVGNRYMDTSLDGYKIEIFKGDVKITKFETSFTFVQTIEYPIFDFLYEELAFENLLDYPKALREFYYNNLC